MFQPIIAEYYQKPRVSEVVFGSNLIADARAAIQSLGKNTVCIYDKTLKEPKLDLPNTLFLPVDAGEKCKERKIKEEIEDALISHKMGADTGIVAVGGGSVLDLAGFVAATYCRGLRLCFFPTTLLAMVDAAIGGKNGVNVKNVKNYVGTLYHPQFIFVDFSYLQTLPDDERQNGLVEMFKIAQVYSPEKVQEFDRTLSNEIKSASFQKAIYDSIQMKIALVQESLQDPSIRDLLNFGHTIGHAIETLQNFQISHGRAVCLGMCAEGYISYRLGHLSKAEFDQMQNCLLQICPGISLRKRYPFHAWIDALMLDKKTKEGNIHIVLLTKRGVPFEKKSSEVSLEAVEEAVLWL